MPLTLRPPQAEIARYQRGRMGVSAVPGSGKTLTLSYLAAGLVASGVLADDQEVLVVTLVNSAVDNFYRRVSSLLDERGLLPNLGYRVRTLHGLAHDIVRERPALVGLEDRFQIIDERESEAILHEATEAWLRLHPDAADDYLDPELDDSRRSWARKEQWPGLATDIARSLIRTAKDLRLSAERLGERLEALPIPLPLASMGQQIYVDYQRALAYRGAVDFDDLIRLAIQALEADPDYLERLRYVWPYILEDEAQDSSRLQEEILGKLAGEGGNWVRVGDPNQAIYETFTTANPQHLLDFLKRPEVQVQELPDSGRSTVSIIDLANYLVQWTMTAHPVEEVRDALHAPPFIKPVAEDDEQPNPPDLPDQVRLVTRRYNSREELEAVADSLKRWLGDHPQGTAAVLSPRNQRGFEMVDELRRRGIPYEDSLLRSSSETRFSAGALGNLLRYLADPGSARKLSTLYRVWRRLELDDAGASAQIQGIANLLRVLPRLEDFIWPGAEHDWLGDLERNGAETAVLDSLSEFRRLVRRWQGATLLPIDQMLLTVAQDLLSQPHELALAHKLSVLLRQASQAHPSWRLPELSEELAVIARNERRFLGFSDEDAGYDPREHLGKVAVATVHKAKGLEWDRVYLLSANNYDYPSAQTYDTYISEKWYLRSPQTEGHNLPGSHLNLEAEALAQLEAALSADEYSWYEEGQATLQARLGYTRERLRLLYVGITRARQELVITWNSGRDGDMQPCVPLVALMNFWEAYRGA